MTDSPSLAARIPELANCRLLCIGDLMLDRFVYGEVSRISPEAPIPVFQISRETTMLGGAGNVVRNATALGAAVCFVAVVGDDAVGRELTALVGAQERVEPYLLVERGRPSTVKTRYIANAQQLLRADSETVRAINDDTAGTVIRVTADAIAGCDVVVVSDYAKGVLPDAVVEAVIGAARAADKPVIVDPKGTDFARYRGASVITPNRRELAEVTGMPANDDGEVAAAAKALIERCALDAVVVTRSQAGLSLVTRDGAAEHLPAQAHEVFDVSGAGDTVIATFALAVGRGIPAGEAARLANHAAGIVVGKVGTAVVYGDDLLRAIHAGEWSAAEAKVVSFGAALDRIEQWRGTGKRIAFANGCFDLLHPGHVSLLQQAKAAGDRLVVGLNSDASVARVKGDDRPIQPEGARAQVLASLASVDLVVVFEEDTPMALIEAIRPEVLVKGADYRLEEVVGADFVKDYGGKVLLAEITEGYSTTETIGKIAR
ncbi:MAG: D-glycero-beta-D-manno-heptose-7-phosphate kinase [Proteobacteria bacterium]|nr:D-glycero-beta-D-manno-heptose-7-phosphate kinase [Pseudomonadota bacterium]